jgi:hypothetical protein
MHMWRWPNRVLAALAVTVLLAAAGCSVTTPGVPVAASGGPHPALNRLDTGTFPTDPAPPLGTAGSASEGSLIEARRMAVNVAGPWEVDPALVTPTQLRATVFNTVAGVALIEPMAGMASAAQAHNFINGFASDRQGMPELRLMNAVLRFADPASAAAAAADMAAAAAAANQPDPGRATVQIPGRQDTRAAIDSTNLSARDQHPITVVAFTAHGAYVLCQTAQAHDIDAATALIAKTLDLQAPLIDQFVPTDPARFADLPADPTGLLAHTMPAPMWPDPQSAAPANPKIGLYQPHGALHLQNDPPSAAAAFAAAGVPLMSYNHTSVYKARDATAAAQLAADLADAVIKSQPSAAPVDGVDNMPTSRCVQSAGTTSDSPVRYSCFAPAGTYTIEAHDADPRGAREQTAAQYKMLVAL